jgi:dTDP-4-amino-4,6-dideoxygalactose transaminase
MRLKTTRRTLLGAASALVLGAGPSRGSAEQTPAVLGGKPVRSARFPSWPIIGENDKSAWLDVLRSGIWNRLDGKRALTFEQEWARKLGAKHGLATSSGTTALFASLNALGVGPGDEVIVPPYTFVATINVVLLQHALPVFVDTDPETFQIDARKIESALTDRTACLLPAHIGGSPADLDTILEIGRARKIPVLEDACQAHLGEWKHKKLGTLGALGCFSFQASKNLNSGEGGAIVTDGDDLIAQCRSFHNNGRSAPGAGFTFSRNGCNLRITEFQATLLTEQMTRLDAQARTREQNAAYLSGLLREIPGIAPARTYDGCTRNAYHLYMLRYDKTRFDGLWRSAFLRALGAEGIPASGGYSPLYKEPFLKNTLDSRAYRAIYPPERLAEALDRIHCPANERVCEEAVWLTQTMLLGDRSDMDQVAEAIRKIQKHAGSIARA